MSHQVIYQKGTRPIHAWVGTKPDSVWEGVESIERHPDIEETAMKQLVNVAGLPFIAPHGIAVMPDVHAGRGATIGSVIATERAIIPSAVGVDIGCGMNAVRLNVRAEQLPDNLHRIRTEIERVVPTGTASHTNRSVIDSLATRLPGYGQGLDGRLPLIFEDILSDILGDPDKQLERAASQIGTLGGGNHFIELNIDEAGDVWVMLHSGSRGVGNKIGSYFIEQAKELMEKFYIKLPDNDLAYLPQGTPLFDDYVQAVGWAQDYALANRASMMQATLGAISRVLDRQIITTTEAVNCHHNYIERENHFGRNLWVTRKGAIRARAGDLGIIPGSMGAKSFIVRGLGNEDSYCSCSHGAGRKMSRGEARRTFTKDDLAAQTAGIECLKDDSVVDEIPGAYKDIDQVMANQADLVEIVHTLKQVVVVKGGEDGRSSKRRNRKVSEAG